MNPRLKQITEIFHTIFCHRKHEYEMINLTNSLKCCYYLEQTIEDTWNQKDHKLWIEQAEVFLQLSEGGIDMLEQVVKIHKAADTLRQANPLYMKYVDLLIKGGEK